VQKQIDGDTWETIFEVLDASWSNEPKYDAAKMRFKIRNDEKALYQDLKEILHEKSADPTAVRAPDAIDQLPPEQ
jgi:hypothetical protein